MSGHDPISLVELFNVLGSKVAAGEPQSSIFQWLYDYAGRIGLEVRYDEFKKGEYNEVLLKKRLEESQTFARKHYRTAAPKVAPAVTGTISFEEYQARLAKKKSQDAQPTETVQESARETASPPPTSDTKTTHRRSRGTPLAISLDRGKLYIRTDPAIQNPREPPAIERKAHSDAASAGTQLFAYLDADEMLVGRVFIYRDERYCPRRGARKNHLTPIEHEFRSLTIDAVTWRPLAITPRPFSRGSKAVDIDTHLKSGAYEVVVTNDGSLGTIYQWTHPRAGPIWCMATVKGYDVFPYRWSGKQSWAEQLQGLLESTKAKGGKSISELLGTELRENYLCEGDMRVDFGGLDPGYCYTIGMRHHDTHPLLADPQGVWNVQNISLDHRSAYQPIFSGGIPHFAEQQLIGDTITYSELIASTKDSISAAIAAIADGKHGFEHFAYGYILRSKDIGVTGRDSDVLIDSPLLTIIRNKMYARPISKEDRERITAENRNRFGFLRGSLLSSKVREQLLGIYPQFQELDGKVQEFLRNVERYVIETTKHSLVNRESKAKSQSAGYSHPTVCLGNGIISSLQQEHPKFHGFERDVASTVVRGYLNQAVTAMFILTALGQV